ncbi:MAG: hypothetical protein HAW60_01850 [Bdellovibrionales bacterium]|nr:hypothetical protein [Bdellovibrionales bacterium]
MKKIIFMLISGVIVLAFAFFGLTPSFLGGGAGRGIALSVNNEVVSTVSFNNIVRSASKRQSSIQAKSSKKRRLAQSRLKQQLLNELVQLNVIYVSLAESGFYVSPGSVIDQVVSTPAFSENGQFKRTRYESLLKSIGQTPDSFESQIEKSLAYQNFVNWIGQATKIVTLEQKLKDSLLDMQVDLDFFEIKKPDNKKTALIKVFDKKVTTIKQLLKTGSSKNIKNWTKKNKIKLSKSDKVSLLSSYLPILGQNKLAYKNILNTRSKTFVNKLIFHKSSYYLIYVRAIKKAKKNKKASFNMLNKWFARQRQQVAMQSWLKSHSKDLQIYTNQNLIKL